MRNLYFIAQFNVVSHLLLFGYKIVNNSVSKYK